MSPAWVETIVFSHAGAALEKGWKTGLATSKIAQGFWLPLEAAL